MAIQPPPLFAGMPSVLPKDVARVLRLTDSAEERLQAISFFLLGLLVSAWFVRLLWNFLQKDFRRLPRLTYGKAIAVVALWGLLFVVVLTMISGARELMTPEAWDKRGFTYQLDGDGATAPAADLFTDRMRSLKQLRSRLWSFRANHGRLPANRDESQFGAEVWESPNGAGACYIYRPKELPDHPAFVLAFEPDIYLGDRLVLKTDGEILWMSAVDLHIAIAKIDVP